METPEGPTSAYAPHDALADVTASQESVADRLVTPWWYHPVLGALVAAIVLVGAFDMSNVVRIVVALASAVGMGALVGAYQRVTGLWIDIRNLGPVSRRWWAAYAVVLMLVVGTSLLPSFTNMVLPTWFAATLTAIALLATVVLGRRIDAAMRAEIRSGRIHPSRVRVKRSR